MIIRIIGIMVVYNNNVPWRNGEDAGLVIQGLVVRASAQEIFHSNSGLLSFKKPETVLWTIAKYYYYYYYYYCRFLHTQKDSGGASIHRINESFPLKPSLVTNWSAFFCTTSMLDVMIFYLGSQSSKMDS